MSAGTTYYYKVFEYSGAANTNNYYTAGTPASGSQSTLAAEPGTQASSVILSSVTASQMGVAWTSGNGASRLVIARAGSAPSSAPVDGVAYTANAALGSGAALGGGSVVYSGSGSSFTLTGLSPATTYYLQVYEYAGSGATLNYNGNTASGNPNNRSTLAAEPTVSPAVGAFSAVSSSGMTVNWSGGNGTDVIVLMKLNGAVDSNPVDAATYVANAAFGSGDQIGTGNYVIYKGSGTSVPVTGLAVGQTYSVAVYAFNGSGGLENYLTSSFGTGNQTTSLVAPTTPASSIAFANVSPSSVDVSWAAGNGGNRIVVARAGAAVSWTPSDGSGYAANASYSAGTDLGSGNKVVYNGAGNSVSLSGLSAGTTYHFEVFEYNGVAATAIYLTAGEPVANTTTWATEPTTAASGVGFTGISKTGFTVTWTPGNGANRLLLVKQGAAVNTLPSDATSYAADSTLGNGALLGAGNYVVYSGSGSSALVTGLTANTSYDVAVVEFAGAAGTANYKTNAFATGVQATLDNESVILRSPATISVTSMVGTTPSAQSFVITNAGGSQLSYTLATNATWLSVNTGSGGPLAANAGQSHTATLSATGLSAGTYNGTITITSTGSGQDAATNSPQTIAATLILTNITDVTSPAATLDGKELVRLSWVSGNTVLVVYKAGTASTAPTQGTTYNLSDACGGGTVVYKGTGTSLEHVVLPGTVNNYAFYVVNNNHYSVGVTALATTGSYGVAPTEIVDTFSYVSGGSLDGKGGGNGFGGNWSESSAGSYTVNSGSFGNVIGYPNNAGNKVKVTPPVAGERTAARALSSVVNSGKLYVSFIMNFQFGGAGKYSGLQFVDGSTEKAFFGEIGSQDQQLGVSSGPATDQGSAYGLTAGASQDYVVFGMYDFSAQTLKVKGYYKTDSIPAVEPAWDATKSSVSIGQITGIRLISGATAGTPGDTYFDEVRVATNWAGLLNMAVSVPAPTAASATVDGAELARLAWTRSGSLDVMIVASTGGALSDPILGQSYAVGAACGGGTVIYKGSASTFQQVVTPGSVNTYRFFSNNGSDLYSTGLTAVATALTYGPLERVEPFGYTNGTMLAGLNGGHGWSGAWGDADNSFAVQDQSFGYFPGYATNYGNKVMVTPPAGTTRQAVRSFSTVSSGKLYLSFIMNYEFAGSMGKFAGVSFMDGGTEKAFFGKISSQIQKLGLSNGSTDTPSAYDLYAGFGHDYLVVGLYDFSTQTLKIKAYTTSDTVPLTEPVSWDTTMAASIGQVTGIRLGSGGSVGVTPGNTTFDEVRVATNWADIVNTLAPATQASAIHFSNLQTMRMDVSWTRGNGAGCIVVAREGSAVSGAPADETIYAANAAYGSGSAVGGGYVIYSGTGTSVTLTGLKASTLYYLQVFEYNGGADALRYSAVTASGNPAQQMTLMSGSFYSIR